MPLSSHVTVKRDPLQVNRKSLHILNMRVLTMRSRSLPMGFQKMDVQMSTWDLSTVMTTGIHLRQTGAEKVYLMKTKPITSLCSVNGKKKGSDVCGSYETNDTTV